MRSLISTLAVASAAAAVFQPPAQDGREFLDSLKTRLDTEPRRKSLGFGPQLNHAKFHSNPFSIQIGSFKPMAESADPFEVAQAFLADVVANKPHSHYHIRSDSYTDTNTGVTHIYAHQLFKGMLVADGIINLNVKDGLVLSYGDSFYDDSAVPTTFQDSAVYPHEQFCSSLGSGLLSPALSAFSPFHVQDSESYVADSNIQPSDLASAYRLWADNCHEGAFVFPNSFPPSTGNEGDSVKSALALFMLTATDDVGLKHQIATRYEEYKERMTLIHTTSLLGHDVLDSSLLMENVEGAVSPVKAEAMVLHQVPRADGQGVTLVPTIRFEVEMKDNWYQAYVTAYYPHKIISVVDWASDSPLPKPPKKEHVPATYQVFKWGINDPEEGNRTTEKENFDHLASPIGWHSLPYSNDPSFKGVRVNVQEQFRNTTTTWGNNVFAQENWEGQNQFIDNFRPNAASSNFTFTYSPKKNTNGTKQEEAYSYINATVTQLFYTCNMVHDLFYRYGFNEVAGNFQQYNFERGGREGDAVIANAQDGSGYNNANFMTPPDGSNGRMRMYLWNTATPYRDGDMEAGIVIHEYSHGISTRLTGGPMNSNCLGWGESGGMGEGWGDFFATSIRSSKAYHDYPMGAWAANTPTGIRNYVYSVNDTVNPSTYKTLDKPGYWGVHAIGEVWAEILWVVSQGLIAEHGYSDTLYPPMPTENGTVPEGKFYRPREGKKPLVPKHGNSLMVQLVVNGMKIQPCNPSFFDARDAIIEADRVLTGGENLCTLWKGFSARGLGPKARVDGKTPWGGGIRTDDYEVPANCHEGKVVT